MDHEGIEVKGVPRVICDGMLGTLAKWLRILGIDAEYFGSEGNDQELIRRAVKEDRIIITRDKGIAARNIPVEVILLRTDDLDEQIQSVLENIDYVPGDEILSRCTVCNVPVMLVSKEDVRGMVPERVYESHDEFYRCPECGRIYWYGSHCTDMEKRIKRIMGD